MEAQNYKPSPNQPHGNFVNKPDSCLVWAILTTVLCCLPFGIVAIVYAARVDTLWFSGYQNEALQAAKTAKTWVIVGIVSSLIVWALYFILIFALGLSAADFIDYM